jgi:hypothetical protein
MAKKTKKKKKVVKKVKEHKNAKEIKYLERLVELSLRNVGQSESLDKLFKNQADRIQSEIFKLKSDV